MLQKISFFSSLPPFRGGISHFSQMLCNALKSKSKLKTYTFKTQYPSILFPGKTQYIKNFKTQKDSAKRIVSTFNPFSYLFASRILKKDNPDVFICNYWMTFFGPMFGTIAFFLPKKVVKIAIIHNLTPHEKRFFDKPFNRFFLNSFDGAIVLSDFVLKDLQKINSKIPAIVIPHPKYDQFQSSLSKSEARNKLKIHPNKKTILFFGIIRDYKGLDLLINAFNELDSTYQLLIAGEVYGSDQKYMNLIESNSNKERIFFNNQFVADENVPTFFSASDCLVLPYKSGTQSGVAAIADKFSIPVIATNVGGISENIKNEVNGIIIHELNSSSISKAIQKCFYLKIPEKLNTTSNKEFDAENEWELFAKKTLEFIDSIPK